MIVNIEESTTRAEVDILATALESENFATACVIAAIEPVNQQNERRIFAKVSGAATGITILASCLDERAVAWAVSALRQSQ